MKNLKILVGVKKNNTLFLKVIENLLSKNQKNLLTITANSFPELLENIVKNYKKIQVLEIPEKICFHNGWRTSQTNMKRALRVGTLTKGEFLEIKKMIKNYTKPILVIV